MSTKWVPCQMSTTYIRADRGDEIWSEQTASTLFGHCHNRVGVGKDHKKIADQASFAIY